MRLFNAKSSKNLYVKENKKFAGKSQKEVPYVKLHKSTSWKESLRKSYDSLSHWDKDDGQSYKRNLINDGYLEFNQKQKEQEFHPGQMKIDIKRIFSKTFKVVESKSTNTSLSKPKIHDSK